MRSPKTAEEQIFYHTGIYTDPTSFDWNANLYCNAEEETFASVLQFNENLEAVADWAETFEPNADASVWTFHIRPDNKGWSDGTPVTAGDFVYSWRRQLDPETKAAYAGFLFDIKYAEQFNTGATVDDANDPLNGKVPTGDDLGAKALDDWTLEVTMAGPRAYFPQVVAYTAAVPAPKWKVEELGDKWALNENGEPIVSNGPFKVDEWNKGQSIKMSKNEGYWDAENIKLTNVIDPIYPAANEVLLYEAGSGDQRLDWAVLDCRQLRALHGGPRVVQAGLAICLSRHLDDAAASDGRAVRQDRSPHGAGPRDRPRPARDDHERPGHAGVLHGSARRVRFPRRSVAGRDQQLRSAGCDGRAQGHGLRRRQELARDHDVHAR